MYFAVGGSPRELSNGESLTFIRPSPCRQFILTLGTNNQLSLWSADRPTLCLSTATTTTTTTSTTTLTSTFIDACWSATDSQSIAVLCRTLNNDESFQSHQLCIFANQSDNSSVALEYASRSSGGTDQTPWQHSQTSARQLVPIRTIHLSAAGVEYSKMCTLRDSILLLTGKTYQCYSWTGTTPLEETVILSDMSDNSFISYIPALNMIAYSTPAGISLLSLAKATPLINVNCHVQMQCVDYNEKHRLLAFGGQDGHVYLFTVSEKLQATFKRRFEPPVYQRKHQPSPITTVAWTSDGCALAVGYMDSGFTIWSVYGRQLCYHTDLEAFEGEDKTFVKGTSHLFWGPGNFNLYLLSSTSGCMFTVPFAKYALAVSNVRDNIRTPFLMAQDRLLVYSGSNMGTTQSASFNSAHWQPIPIPGTYLEDNNPIMFAAASADGKRIAVAGTFGFAHCTLSLGKWKLFGNQQHEKSIQCVRGLVWYRDIVVVSCVDLITMQQEIRFYPSQKNLDHGNVIYTLPVTGNVLQLSILHTRLLVYTDDNILRHYNLSGIDNVGQEYVLQVGEYDLTDIVNYPQCVQSIELFFPATGPFETAIKSAFFAILHQGKFVIAQQTSEKVWMTKIFAENTEFCWSLFTRSPVGDLHNALWAFDGHRAKIWSNVFLEKSDSLKWVTASIKRSLTLTFEFYPISVLFHKGIVVGVDQNVGHSDGLIYTSSAKTFLFLHLMLHWLLTQKLVTEAVAFARNYENFPYFVHSCEILLHSILEKESESLVGFRGNALLPVVVKFLKHFSSFNEIVVQCARKTEVAMWEYLFSIVGDPKEIFKSCLVSGDLKTATSSLIILQTMEPWSVSAKLQVDLLEKTLDKGDFVLCAEIVRYLTSVNSRAVSQETLTSPQPGSTLLAISAEEEQTFYIDILISRHARKLMSRQLIRTVGRLSDMLNFPLVEWLRKERNRSALIRDLGVTFKSLHAQYEWAYPSTTSGRHMNSANSIPSPSIIHEDDAGYASDSVTGTAGSRRATISSGSSVMSRTPSSAEIPKKVETFNQQPMDSPGTVRRRAKSFVPAFARRRLSHRSNVETEITKMTLATKEAKCYSWTVLLATMLLDVGTVAEVLLQVKKNQDREWINLVVDLDQMLKATGSSEYLMFADRLSQLLSLS